MCWAACFGFAFEYPVAEIPLEQYFASTIRTLLLSSYQAVYEDLLKT